MPRRVGDFRGLTQPNRLRLLRAIQQEPGRGVRELAQECHLPLNTARDHLRVLAQEGLIRSEMSPAQGRGRPGRAYHPLVDASDSAAARDRAAGAAERGAMLRAVGDAPAALERDALAQLDVLYEHLDDAGLEPSVDEASLSIELAPCRYHDLISVDQPLVCSVHARLVRDVLGHVDGPLGLHRLEPFVTEHQCRIVLASTPAAT